MRLTVAPVRADAAGADDGDAGASAAPSAAAAATAEVVVPVAAADADAQTGGDAGDGAVSAAGPSAAEDAAAAASAGSRGAPAAEATDGSAVPRRVVSFLPGSGGSNRPGNDGTRQPPPASILSGGSSIRHSLDVALAAITPAFPRFHTPPRPPAVPPAPPPPPPPVRHIRFTVEDDGIGIASENLEKIFAPFTQVNQASNREYQARTHFSCHSSVGPRKQSVNKPSRAAARSLRARTAAC